MLSMGIYGYWNRIVSVLIPKQNYAICLKNYKCLNISLKWKKNPILLLLKIV